MTHPSRHTHSCHPGPCARDPLSIESGHRSETLLVGSIARTIERVDEWVPGTRPGMTVWGVAAAVGLFGLLGTPTAALAAGDVGGAVSPFVYQFMVFVIAIFVGYFVVWSVTAALHTPLMSVTNAISSVIVVGALLSVGVVAVNASSWIAKLFGFLALVMASVNIFGGFMVTSRMLAMYKKKDGQK